MTSQIGVTLLANAIIIRLGPHWCKLSKITWTSDIIISDGSSASCTSHCIQNGYMNNQICLVISLTSKTLGIVKKFSL